MVSPRILYPIRQLRVAVLFLFVAGCSVTLISKYDEVIDKGISDFQRRMDLFLIQKQKLPPPIYRDTFYDSVFVDLQILQTRAASVSLNSQTTQIIKLLADQVHLIKSTDSLNAGSSAFFLGAANTIDQNCQNALKLELAKKRGD